MKKRIPLLFVSLSITFLFAVSLIAQEKTELTVQVKKDGKVVKDTTYQFEDEAEAKHAVKMMELMTGDNEHMEEIHYNYSASGGKHAKTMVFISENGENTVIKKMHGDSLVWIEEGDDLHEAHGKGEHVIIMKSDDGETFDILIDEESEGHDCVKKKEIKVVVSGDAEGSWTVDSNELVEIDEEKNVIIIKNEDGDVDLEKIMEEHEGEDVKVIVIKKDGEDGDDEVEVKVIKKETKEEK